MQLFCEARDLLFFSYTTPILVVYRLIGFWVHLLKVNHMYPTPFILYVSYIRPIKHFNQNRNVFSSPNSTERFQSSHRQV